MDNYNVDEAACTLYITCHLKNFISMYGPRGYRLLNARIGEMTQLAYLSAAVLKLDCGAALGVRAQVMKELLGLGQGEEVVLAFYLGTMQRPCFLFDFRLG
ncbi:hypothetical protein X744_22530 [Mesorhizobium sp. LNJC372A00]|nr:hypothetical protein X745_20840 [Mesorhizobium sp. LNJC374B00]ESY56001.1 hypothetical protein X744_22530 [Mesorhizobium sp. LNJC372A00]